MSRKGSSSRTTSPAAARSWTWRDVRPEWAAALIVMIALSWMVTEGEWNFFGVTGRLEGFYEGQAESLLQGRIDVPREAIGDEAFVRNGKNYGYFGPTPALFRIPLVLLAPEMNGKWSRLSMLAAAALMLWATILLLRRIEELQPDLARSDVWRWMPAAFVATVGLGSTELFLCSESKVYQESIQWASTLALVSAVCLLSFLMRPGVKWLALACIAAFLAFFARVSSGAGPIAAFALLDAALLMPEGRATQWLGVPKIADRRRAVAMLSATIALTAALWMGVNYWKFGVLFASQPLALNVQYNAERVARIKGELASLYNVPLTLTNYLKPGNVMFTNQFPWVGLTSIPRKQLVAQFPAAHFDYADWFASLPAGMPALFLAAIAGTALCFRRGAWTALRIPLIGAVAGCGLTFAWGLLAYRYLHDLFPWQVLGAAVALAAIARMEAPDWRRGLTGILGVLAVYSMWANFSFGLVHQRLRSAPVPIEKRMAFQDMAFSTTESGIGGLLRYWTHWRSYLGAMHTENAKGLVLRSSERPDSPVVRSDGPPPYVATYRMTAPEDGEYELAVRCASTEMRPVLLGVNGKVIGSVCAFTTPSEADTAQRWSFAGRHRLRRGAVDIRLASNDPLPALSCLRLVRLD